MEEKLKVLDSLVNQALDMLYERDMHLITNHAVNSRGKDEQHHVGERSIVFRFAHYLLNLIDDNSRSLIVKRTSSGKSKICLR